MSRDNDGAFKIPGQHPAYGAYRAGVPASSSAWSRVGRAAGYVAGGAFLAQTVLFLLDVTGVVMLSSLGAWLDVPRSDSEWSLAPAPLAQLACVS
jgi:hypothetical protein